MAEDVTYISGKITGYDIDFARRKFKETSVLLVSAGRIPMNPFDIGAYHPDKTWEEYMVEDIEGLLTCKSIVMQPDWIESRGARIEKAIAEIMEFEIIYENDLQKLNNEKATGNNIPS